MLLIRATPKASPVHGIGLYADEDISAGTRVWQYSPGLDIELGPEVFEKLSQREKDTILFYGFKSRKTDNYHLSFDNVRFINHAENGNVTLDTSVDDVEYPVIAKRDISAGEEITHNYYEFDDDHQL